MKKLKLLMVLASILGLFSASAYAVEKQYVKGSQVRAQFVQLIQEHQKFIQAAYGSAQPQKVNAVYNTGNNFEQNFFLYTGFLQDAHIQNFLQSVEADIGRNGRPGYTMMSYTNFVMVGGKSRSIQYTYQSNGKDITLVKQSNDNGKMLKSVYIYDVNSRSLKADDFRENQVIHEKVYKI